MQPDQTITIEELPILDQFGDEFGMAWAAEVDLCFDGSDAWVVGVRMLSQNPRGVLHVIFGKMLEVYDEFIRKNYDSVIDDPPVCVTRTAVPVVQRGADK